MTKKIVSLLCLLSLIATLMPGSYVFAEEAEKTYEKETVMQVLGIEEAAAASIVTNDYLLTALSGFLYGENERRPAESFAREVGILEFGEIYDGRKTITKIEALEYALATLGYKDYAKSTGENGIKTVASSLGITKGLGTTENEEITFNECVVMLHNMLEVAPMVAIYSGGQVKHIIEKEQTLLSKYRDVHKITGLLTSNGITSLDKEASCEGGYIQIGTSLYIMEDSTPCRKLLGKYVEAYVLKDEYDEPIVLCIGEKSGRNREFIVDARDVKRITPDYTRLEYYENNREKYLKIADVPRVIYNGVFYGGYTEPDFKPESGNIRLLDNNNDGKYDVIFINSYETVVVGAVDTNRKIIYNKFKSQGNLVSIDLDTEVSDVVYTINDEFGEVEISDIKKGDILVVAKSKSNENIVVEILVSRDTFVGKLQSINEIDMEILVDDEEYSFVNSFLRFRNEEGSLNLGNTYNFFMDALGNVAYWEKVTEDGYAVIERVYRDWDKDRLYASYMNMSGIWIDATIATKFTFEGTFYSRLDVDTAYEILKDIKGEVVKLTFNQSEEIKIIETATETPIPDENGFTKTSSKNLSWRSEARTFTDDNTAQCKYYLEDDAKVIVLPADPANYRNRSEYVVRDAAGYFRGDTPYTVSFYDFDEFGFAKLVVMRYSTEIRNTLFIVTGVQTILDEGEIRAQATGYAGDYENFTLTGEDTGAFTYQNGNAVKKGDIIKVSVNAEGYVDSIEPVFKLSDMEKNDGSQYLDGRQYQVSSYMAGIVEAVAADKNRILVEINGTNYAYVLDYSANVHIYSPTEGLKSASIYDIMEQDKIFIRLSYGSIQQIIIHE